MQESQIIIDERAGRVLGFDAELSSLAEFVFEADLAAVEAYIAAGLPSFDARTRTAAGQVERCRFSVVRAGHVRAVTIEKMPTPVVGECLTVVEELVHQLQTALQVSIVFVADLQADHGQLLAWSEGGECIEPPEESVPRSLLEALVDGRGIDGLDAAAWLKKRGMAWSTGVIAERTHRTVVVIALHSCAPERSNVAELLSLGSHAVAAELGYVKVAAALDWSNERFRIAVSTANLGVWDYDLVGGTVTVDGRDTTQYQQISGELRGWGKLIHPDDVPMVAKAYEASLKSGEAFRCSFRVLEGAEVRYLESTGRPVFRDGRPVRMIGTHVDVTERTVAQLRAVEQSHRLELALNSAGMGLWEWDPETDAVSGSVNVLELGDGVFAGPRHAYMDIIPPEDRAMVMEWLAARLDGEGPNGISHRVQIGDDVRWVEVRGDRIATQDPNKTRVMGVVWDATEHREKAARLAQAEAELRRSNQRYTMAAEAAGVGLWEADIATDELTWDARMLSLFGVEEGDAGDTGAVWSQRVHPDDIDRVNDEIRGAFTAGKASTQFRIVLPGGEVRHVQSFASYVDDGHGPKLIGLCLDVTQERLAELRERNRNRVLETMISSASVGEVLDVLVRAIEAEIPEVRVGFMLVDDSGKKLINGAAPSLTEAYLQAANGLPIEVGNGSCGSSAALRRPVLVEDCHTHPYWQKFLDAAAEANFRACWSIPIIGSDHVVFGTLGAYFHHVQPPDETLLRRLTEAADFASLAISKKNAEVGLKNREALLKATGEIAKVAGWEVDLRTDTRRWTDQMYRIHGLEIGETIDQDGVIGMYSRKLNRPSAT
ncbi:MAG: PAS domain-containing protein [bacterium]